MSDVSEDLSLINSFITTRKESVLFISASNELISEIPPRLGQNYQIVDLKLDDSPLKPFGGIIFDAQPEDSLIEDNVYSLHKDIFRSYLKTGFASERQDVIFEQEYTYEKKRMAKSIAGLLKNCCTKNYLFLNTQCLFEENFEIMEQLEDQTLPGKMVFCFDDTSAAFQNPVTISFFEKITEKLNFLHITTPARTVKKINDQAIDSNYKRRNSYETVIQNLHNYRLFMAFGQAKALSESLSDDLNSLLYTREQKREIYLELGKIAYDTGSIDEAILYENNVLEDQVDDSAEYQALLYQAKAFVKKNSYELAEKYSGLLQFKLNNDRHSYLVALAKMIDFLVSSGYKSEQTREKYREALDILEENNLINNYVGTCVKIPWGMITDSKQQDYIYSNLDKALDYALKLDNQHLVSSAYHWKAIVLSYYGHREEAMHFNKECNRIRTEIGEIRPLLAIRNGISYESMCAGNYVEAYNILNSVISSLYTINDYSTIIDTLKNISYAVFFCRHFDMAEKIFQLMIHLLSVFRMVNSANNSFLPVVNDLMIYKTMIDIDRGDYIHAKMNYSNIINNEQPVSDVDRPFLKYILAIKLLEEGNVQKAMDIFALGVEEFEECGVSQTHKIVFMSLEFAKILHRMGYYEEAKQYLDEGFTLAKSGSLVYYTKDDETCTLEKYLTGVEEIEPLNINLDFIEEKAEKDKYMNQLHSKIHDYQFLNKVRSLNTSSMPFDEYLRKVMESLNDYIMVQNLYFAEYVTDSWNVICSIEHKLDSKFPVDELWPYLFDENREIAECQLLFDEQNHVYYADLSKYDFKYVLVIVPGERRHFDSDLLNILNIALSCIQSQIVIYKQNENLRFISNTDQLSLLHNRHSLQEFLNVESERIRRAGTRNRKSPEYVIAFIDLDNFKYYNDTFGHDAGDLFIKCFADLLKKTLRSVDYIARFGGDEFVVVMQDYSVNEAFVAEKRLRENLKAADHFIPELRQHLGNRTILIPENKKLGFSAGVCSNLDMEDKSDLNGQLLNADKALYYSKEHGKGCITRWTRRLKTS